MKNCKALHANKKKKEKQTFLLLLLNEMKNQKLNNLSYLAYSLSLYYIGYSIAGRQPAFFGEMDEEVGWSGSSLAHLSGNWYNDRTGNFIECFISNNVHQI